MTRTIRRATRFKKDLKRELKSHGRALAADLDTVVMLLAEDEPLPERCQDHALRGEWKGYRDCHVRPDLVLIYRKPDDDTLRLARLGSHSELAL